MKQLYGAKLNSTLTVARGGGVLHSNLGIGTRLRDSKVAGIIELYYN